MLSPCAGQVLHALLTRPPLTYISLGFNISPFDLHVLSTPPAFILSQDRTLVFKFFSPKIFPRMVKLPFSSSFPFFSSKNFCPFKVPLDPASLLWLSFPSGTPSASFPPLLASLPVRFTVLRSFFLNSLKIFFGIFRVALLFICQGALFRPSRNSDIVALSLLLVNIFFLFFSIFFSILFFQSFHFLINSLFF